MTDAWARDDEATWEPVDEPAEPNDGGPWEPVEDPADAWDPEDETVHTEAAWEDEPIGVDDPADQADAEEHDFLVFVEEEDDGSVTDDRLVLEVARQHALGEIQVHPEIQVDLRNTATPTSTVGLWSALFGALMGLFAIGLFIATYPQKWYDGNDLLVDEPTIYMTAFAGALSALFLVLGAVLTHYGQRLQATGSLRSLRITEHATGRSARIHQ